MALGLPMALLYSSLISGGSGLLGGMLGGDSEDETKFEYQQLPGYAESDAARGTWWQKLQDWASEPGYGAIQPDWGKIWDNASSKVHQYYWGGAGSTGLAGKVKASAARRGVSDSPALEASLATLGQDEAIQMKDLAATQAQKQADLSESGRNTWLQSLMGLSSIKPSYMTSVGTTEGDSDISDYISGIGSGLGSIISSNSQQNWLQNLFKQYGGGVGGTTTSSSISPYLNLSSNLGKANKTLSGGLSGAENWFSKLYS